MESSVCLCNLDSLKAEEPCSFCSGKVKYTDMESKLNIWIYRVGKNQKGEIPRYIFTIYKLV